MKRTNWVSGLMLPLSLAAACAVIFMSCDLDQNNDNGKKPEKPLWTVPADTTEMSADVWANGEITGENEEVWYSFNVSKDTEYRIWWNERVAQGDGSKTGNIVVGMVYENGTLIFGNSIDTAVDAGWTTPQSFTAAVSGTVYIRVKAYGADPSNTGTFGIVYSTGDTRPAVSWNLPANVSELSADVWAIGEITEENEEVWYSFNVSEGTEYSVWWNDSKQGDDSKTADVVVGARYYENGEFIFGNFANNFSALSVDSGWNTPQSFTAAVSGTVYVRVKSYSTAASNTGTFGIVYSTGSTRPVVIWNPPANVTELVENIWADGEVTGVSEEIWYSIDVTEGETYRIWWNEKGTSFGDGSKTGDIVVGARYENGTFIFGNTGNNFSTTAVDSGWNTPQSFTAAVSGTVYVRVKSYGTTSTSYLGTFGIVYSTGTTRPVVIWNPPANVTELVENVWADGEVTSASEEIWYSIDVSEGETYRIWWNRTGSLYGDGSKTGNVAVGARHEDGTFFFGNYGSVFSVTGVNNGWSTPQSFTANSSGTVYVRVVAYNTTASNTGTFGIVYSTGTTRPLVPSPLLGKWYDPKGEVYDFRSDGKLIVYEFDFGITYTTNGNTVTVTGGFGQYQGGTATFAVSGSGTTAGLIISNAGTDAVLSNGRYTRSSTTPLTEGVWTEGTVTSESVPIYYSFEVTGGTTYNIWVDDRYNNNGSSRTGDVAIMAYDVDDEGTPLWPDVKDDIWTAPASFTATANGTVYIGVLPYTSGTGTFRIVYSTGITRPN